MRTRTSTAAAVGSGDHLPPPPATRQSRARVLDARLVGGVLLLVASAAAGALLLSRGEETVTVWRATHDLAAGAVPGALEAVAVPRVLGEGAYADASTVIDVPLRWPVAAGSLVPRAALATGVPPTRRVTVPVDPLHAPVGLQPGDLVDVWAAPPPVSGVPLAAPRMVLAEVVVIDVSDDGIGLGGELAVVLDVPVGDVDDVVAAAHAGSVDLVAVPITAQGPGA